MWGIFQVRSHSKHPTKTWGGMEKKTSKQKGGQVVTPMQAEVERARAMTRTTQKGKGVKRKSTQKKETVKKKKTDKMGPPGSGWNEFPAQQKTMLNKMMK